MMVLSIRLWRLSADNYHNMGISVDQWKVSIGLFDCSTFRRSHLYCYIRFSFVFLFKYLMQLSLYFYNLCYLLTSFLRNV